MVEKIARAVSAVGNELKALAQPRFRGVDLGAHDLIDGLDAVAVHQLVKAAAGDVVGGDHRLEVEADDMRQPRHAHDHLPDVFAQHALLDELHARQQHGFLLHVGGGERPAAERHAAGIEFVRA